jgi:uncharacterized RDD family membrane protein YckC
VSQDVQSYLACSNCGRALAQSDLVQIAGSWVCADCKPAFLSRMMASGAAGAFARRYAGFWIRVGARFIDGLVFIVPTAIVAALLLPNFIRAASQTQNGAAAAPPEFAALGFIGFFLFSFVIGGCYEILMLKHRSATLGKMACGLKVIRSDGQSLSWGVCVGRFFMWNVVTSGVPYLNMILMPISLIMLGVDGEKRALHDRVCDTRVVYK